MLYKWIGACFIIIGCGGFGFSVAASHRRDERTLRQLVSVLDYMECDLQYHMTPLPDLCRKAAEESGGYLRDIFWELADYLDLQISPDVGSCMHAIVDQTHNPPQQTAQHLLLLGSSLGRFDLKGSCTGWKVYAVPAEEYWKKWAVTKRIDSAVIKLLDYAAAPR